MSASLLFALCVFVSSAFSVVDACRASCLFAEGLLHRDLLLLVPCRC